MGATTTLILGAGFGGISAANGLRLRLPAEHRIVLIDRAPSFHIGATKPWVMLGQKTVAEVSYSRHSLRLRGIDLMETEIEGIDVGKGEVTTGQGALRGDYLIIALGADYNMTLVPGLDRAAHEFYSLEGAARLRDVLRDFSRGDLVILIPRTPFKCPPAPYEGAMLLHHALKERGVRDDVRIAVYTVEGAPMATAGPDMGKLVRDELASRSISLYPAKKTVSVDAERRTVKFDDGSEARYDLLVTIPPHVAPAVVRDAGLVNQSGWIPVDPQTLRVIGIPESRSVYAIGDVAVVPLPGRYKPDIPLVLPKAGTLADAQGQVVASQIASQVLGERSADVFGGVGACYIETGGQHAVKAEGHFFALPHPVMRASAPDSAQYRGKLSWMTDWLRTNL